MSRPKVAVRRLGRGDLDALRELNALFGEVFDDPESYADRPPDDDYLQRLLAREEFIALAAWDGDTMIGALAAYELVKFEQQRSEIYIYDLAVREAWRRQGVATALIEVEADRGGVGRLGRLRPGRPARRACSRALR